MADFQAVMQQDKEYVLGTYGRSPIGVATGAGMYCADFDGRRYLDFTSGIGVNSLGFCDAQWADAVAAQAHTMQHISNLYYTAPCAQLAESLCERTGMDKVFFANSGAEANEGAIKAARKYSFDKYGAGRYKVITLVQSFHGRTIATLTATGQEGFHQYFGPFNAGFAYVPAGDLEALKEAADDTACAVMLELVQGEGGVNTLDKRYVEGVAALCKAKDLILIVDEVQTGVGRTGTFLACEQFALQPDIVTLAKGLGGGLPIGAVLLKEKAAAGMTPGTHGSTFGGNPVACAGANVVLARLDEEKLAQLRALAADLRAKLAALPHVTGLSGLGLMVGIQLDDALTAAALREKCAQKGLLVLTAKSRLRLLPPLVLTQADVDAAVAILAEAIGDLAEAAAV